MNKIGIYYAYWTHDWDADFVPFVAKVKKLGFDVLEVNAGTVANMSAAEQDLLKRAAREEGIELTYCIGLTAEYDVASADEATRHRGVTFLKRLAAMLKNMDGRTLGGIVYGSWPGKMPAATTDRRPYLERSIASIREVMKAFEDAGAYLNLEVVNRFEQFLINTADEAVTFAEHVDSPNCKVLLDTFHMNIEEDNLHDAIVRAGKHLGHVHIGETNRRPPGRGRFAWDEFFNTLNEIGYAGAITMEPFLMPGGQVGRDISVYRDMKGELDLDDEARRACAFVREKLKMISRR